VEEVVSYGRLRWYGHMDRIDKSDWVSVCRELQVELTKGKGRVRKTGNECVKVGHMKRLGLIKDDAI